MSRRTVTRLAAGAAGVAAAMPILTASASPRSGGSRFSRLTAQEGEAPSFEEVPPENDEGTMVVQFYEDGSSMNPHLWDGAGGMAVELIFQTLVIPNPESGEWEPSLAESWEVAEDGVTWTFNLREGVTWHDGTPFTAEDGVFTYEQQLIPEIGSLVLATIAENLAAIEAIDDRTVVMTATGVNSGFLNLTTEFLAPAHIWRDVPPADVPTHPGTSGTDPSLVVGTGPFRLVERIPQDHLTVERYDGYWDGPAQVERIITRYGSNPSLVRTGEQGWGFLTFDVVDEYAALDNLNVYQ